MTAMAGELARITAERVQAELTKLLLGAAPRRGLELLVDTGLADVVLPELPALRMAADEHGQHKDVYAHTLQVLDQAIDLETEGPDLVLRWAAVLHDIGKPATRRFEAGGRVTFHHHEVVGARLARKRLKALRYPTQIVDEVAQLVFLHLRFYGYGRGEWTDSAVRRYVVDAGPLLPRLHKLVRSDCTTRNKRKAAALAASYDALEERIDALREQEELDAIRPDLDGNEIMAVLGIPPGPRSGRPTSTCWSCGWSTARSDTTVRWQSSGSGRRPTPATDSRLCTGRSSLDDRKRLRFGRGGDGRQLTAAVKRR